MTEEQQSGNREPRDLYCNTPTAQSICDLVSFCRDTKSMGLIVGNPGVGKTTALTHFAKTFYEARLCSMSPAHSSMSGALAKVCTALKSYPARSIREMHEVICNALSWSGEIDILMFDEAQHLTNQTLEELRCIHDQTDTAMVFSGNATFQSRFNKAKGAVFAQFTSRVSMRLELWEPTSEDILAFCRHHNITGDKEFDFLSKHAKSNGGLRTISKLINVAGPLAGSGRSISLPHLKAASGMLLGVTK
jgi:hypothetical protein